MWENVPSEYASNKDLNQFAHACCLIRDFIIRVKEVCILVYLKCAKWRFWSACANAQADLNLHCAHMSEDTFLDVAVHLWRLCPGFTSFMKTLFRLYSFKSRGCFVWMLRWQSFVSPFYVLGYVYVSWAFQNDIPWNKVDSPCEKGIHRMRTTNTHDKLVQP